MKKELDEQLCKDFPLTFRDRHASMQNTCMCWGFSHSDGWEKIIRKACEKIEPRIQQLIDEGQENEEEGLQWKAVQVKEKFGTLRFYFTTSDPIIDVAIKEAEKASAYTCEECGEPGNLRGKGWLYTACQDCHETRIRVAARDRMFYDIIWELKERSKVKDESQITEEIKHLEEWRKEKEKDDEQDN